ncbi:minor capsid protein [Heyndrickxia acidicola]|uniref:Minor capsid protein n=1 Tax=Heyndrickxia acidicola TaxID=209389 RepID=A0ABU6MBE5_9BACI|nr:minor capsid protein [Heyndrickxia acidicola]MED1201961.1 minor capsid protein [Heyndrickxia acidicola]
MARRLVPKTKFPYASEVFYYRELNKLVKELGKVTMQVFNDQIKPQVVQFRMKNDSESYRVDGPLDIIQRAIDVIKGLSLGIFSNNTIQSISSRFVTSVNSLNKTNMDAQAKVRGINPIQSEPWLDEYIRTSIKENVNYISTIKDEYFSKIESIILQGVKNGDSIKSVRDQLVERVGMTQNRAKFIAVDQTGSIFGQMTAKRHQEMGVEKFKWTDSGDSRVRKRHRELNGNVYSYADPPSEGLPGTPFRCRCVAVPVFE